MAAEYTGHRSLPTLEDCLYGKTRDWPGGEAYAALERAKLKKYRLGVENGTPLAEEIDALLARDEQ
jgi:tRNA (adenine22-N1)-methyltransferase